MPKRKPKIVALVFGTILFVVILASLLAPAHAQTGGTYELTWSTIDSGGATFSTGGSYELGGTMGQPDAGNVSGGTYSLGGGFWGFLAPPGNSNNNFLYLPLIIK